MTDDRKVPYDYCNSTLDSLLVGKRVYVYPTSTGKKLSRKVKEHGNVWLVESKRDYYWLLSTINPVHAGGHPYSIWVNIADCVLESV